MPHDFNVGDYVIAMRLGERFTISAVHAGFIEGPNKFGQTITAVPETCKLIRKNKMSGAVPSHG